LWHQKFVTADITTLFVNNQHGIQQQGQDFDKKLYFTGYTAKRLTDEFPAKSRTKCGVNKPLKKLRETGTVDKRPGSGRLHSARTEEKTVNDLVLSQEDKLQETGIHQRSQNVICLHFLPYLPYICRKFAFFNFPR